MSRSSSRWAGRAIGVIRRGGGICPGRGRLIVRGNVEQRDHLGVGHRREVLVEAADSDPAGVGSYGRPLRPPRCPPASRTRARPPEPRRRSGQHRERAMLAPPLDPSALSPARRQRRSQCARAHPAADAHVGTARPAAAAPAPRASPSRPAHSFGHADTTSGVWIQARGVVPRTPTDNYGGMDAHAAPTCLDARRESRRAILRS
jgi:hypothetical protein